MGALSTMVVGYGYAAVAVACYRVMVYGESIGTAGAAWIVS